MCACCAFLLTMSVLHHAIQTLCELLYVWVSMLPVKGAPYVDSETFSLSLNWENSPALIIIIIRAQHRPGRGSRMNQWKPSEGTKAGPLLSCSVSEEEDNAGDKGSRWVWTAGFSAWTPSMHAGIRDRLPDGRFVWSWASRASPTGAAADQRPISSYSQRWKSVKYSTTSTRRDKENCSDRVENQKAPCFWWKCMQRSNGVIIVGLCMLASCSFM